MFAEASVLKENAVCLNLRTCPVETMKSTRLFTYGFWKKTDAQQVKSSRGGRDGLQTTVQ